MNGIQTLLDGGWYILYFLSLQSEADCRMAVLIDLCQRAIFLMTSWISFILCLVSSSGLTPKQGIHFQLREVAGRKSLSVPLRLIKSRQATQSELNNIKKLTVKQLLEELPMHFQDSVMVILMRGNMPTWCLKERFDWVLLPNSITWLSFIWNIMNLEKVTWAARMSFRHLLWKKSWATFSAAVTLDHQLAHRGESFQFVKSLQAAASTAHKRNNLL